ncbi:MAG TPA: hypothetical protein VGM54_25985 [Chthoniobacter sp.]
MQPPEIYRPLTIGDWIITKIVLAIPLVGIVMLFVWAFSSDTHPSKKTFCQSALIIIGCIFGLGMLFVIVGGGLAAILGHAAQQQQLQQ